LAAENDPLRAGYALGVKSARTLIVLAGGQSLRMGRDKASLPAAGRTLLEHVVDRLSPVVDEVLVAGGDLVPPGLRLRAVADQPPGRGPLAGMLGGFQAARSTHAWVVACDLPEVEPDLGDLLFSAIGEQDAAVPWVAGRAQGTCAVYRVDLAPRVRNALAEGTGSILSLLHASSVCYIQEDALRRVDPSLRSFTNLNTPEDYERWLRTREAGPT
jgi:molybdopterin-guanine dinucleotide biosynthesis protein A